MISACLPVLVAACTLQEPAQDAVYPASTALAEGLSPAALDALDELVQSFVEAGDVVGAELLVLKNSRTVLHRAYGWRDREAQLPMETGGVSCVRSMTKPLIGAAVWMLIEEDRLELRDPISRHLPALDAEGTRDITVEQLLHHTSGLPMSLILGKDLADFEGIGQVAALAAGHALEFPPGTDFHYSDQGTDTLTALIEAVTGAPAADFVRERLLAPLGMTDSTCVLTADHPLRARAVSKYAGTAEEWSRYWSPEDPPLFPFFLGSQALYSTARDYARFLELYLGKGRVDGERLLRRSSVRKILAPGPFPMGAGTGFPDLRVDYGGQIVLWSSVPQDDGEDGELVALGHSGSDGTYAWAFPEHKAMVLYFTQSRGNPTGLRVEEALGQLFLGAPYDPMQDAPPLEPYLGYYWEGEGDLYRAIIRDGDDLALEIQGQGVVPLIYAGDDRWKLRPNPTRVLEFDRAETGEVTGFHIGDHHEFRFEPLADLPSADDLAARVAAAHRLDLLETLGPMRVRGTLKLPKLGLEGSTTSWFAWPDRWRHDESVGEESERVAWDGSTLRHAVGGEEVSELAGLRAQRMLENTLFTRFGDWRQHFPQLTVIQRLQGDAGEVFAVRAGDTSAPALTLYVHGESGRVARVAGVAHVENLGRIGQRLTFGDFREVSGVLLPHRTEIQLSHPMIGTIEATVDQVEFGVELAEGLFELGDG